MLVNNSITQILACRSTPGARIEPGPMEYPVAVLMMTILAPLVLHIIQGMVQKLVLEQRGQITYVHPFSQVPEALMSSSEAAFPSPSPSVSFYAADPLQVAVHKPK